MTPGSWMEEVAGVEQQGIEGAVRTLARSLDIMAQIQELLPDCFPGTSEETAGLVRQISGSMSRALTALTTPGGPETQAAYHHKSRRSQNVSSSLSSNKCVSAKKGSSTKRIKHVHHTTQIIEWPFIDDGFMWKKYGQKNIKFAKHPRSYFRCSQSNPFPCPAVKLVQQRDSDVPMFAVTYIGRHTCQYPLLHDDDGRLKGVTINFASRSLLTSDSGVRKSLPSSQCPLQWWPAQTGSNPLELVTSKQTVEIPNSSHQITTSPSFWTTAITASCPEEGDSPASSGGSAAALGDILDGLCFSDDEDFLLR